MFGVYYIKKEFEVLKFSFPDIIPSAYALLHLGRFSKMTNVQGKFFLISEKMNGRLCVSNQNYKNIFPLTISWWYVIYIFFHILKVSKHFVSLLYESNICNFHFDERRNREVILHILIN